MTGPLPLAVIVAALVLAGWALLVATRNRPAGRPLIVALAALELLVLVQAVVALAAMSAGRPTEKVTFVGYVITVVAIPAAAGALAWFERTRWGPVIICVACLVVPVLVLRLQQIWRT